MAFDVLAAGAHFVHRAAASEKGGGVAGSKRVLAAGFDVFFHAGESFKIRLSDAGRAGAVGPKPGGEPEDAHAVDQAEADGLGAAAQFFGDGLWRQSEDQRGCFGVDVAIGVEDLDQLRIA